MALKWAGRSETAKRITTLPIRTRSKPRPYMRFLKAIVPAFYDRRADGLPTRWLSRMKSSIATLCPEFNMHRMVMQYIDEYYVAADARYRRFNHENAARTRQFAAWLTRVESAWPLLTVNAVRESLREVTLGNELEVWAHVNLNTLNSIDVSVQVLTGRLNADGEITQPITAPMFSSGKDDAGCEIFHAKLSPSAGS